VKFQTQQRHVQSCELYGVRACSLVCRGPGADKAGPVLGAGVGLMRLKAKRPQQALVDQASPSRCTAATSPQPLQIQAAVLAGPTTLCAQQTHRNSRRNPDAEWQPTARGGHRDGRGVTPGPRGAYRRASGVNPGAMTDGRRASRSITIEGAALKTGPTRQP
jgi:hypothetical protein